MPRLRSIAPAVALLVLALAGCAQTSPYAPSETVFGDWRLAETTGDTAIVVPDAPQSRPTLTIDANATGGQTPCNRYQASVNGGAGEFSITPTTVTEAACADAALMDLEGAYLDALRSVDAAAVDGETLTLSGGGIELRFERLGEVAASELIGTTWMLSALTSRTADTESASGVSDGGSLTFAINAELSGSGGCRDFTGRYTLSGSTVAVSGLEFAAADCPPLVAEQEEHIRTVLESGFSVSIDGDDDLTIATADGTLGLRYTAEE